MLIRNKWYVASWPKDITREPTSRTILNEMIVVYRLEDGSAVALGTSPAIGELPVEGETRSTFREMSLSSLKVSAAALLSGIFSASGAEAASTTPPMSSPR